MTLAEEHSGKISQSDFASRVELLALAMASVNGMGKSGGTINTADLAQRLLSEFPESSIAIDELETEIARLAIAEGVPVEFDRRPSRF